MGIGTDGAAHGGLSLWNEMRIFRSVMNVTCGVPLAEPAIMPAKTILDMVTKGGAACLGEETGTIAVGKRADLIGIDLDAPHLWISRGDFQHSCGERQCRRCKERDCRR